MHQLMQCRDQLAVASEKAGDIACSIMMWGARSSRLWHLPQVSHLKRHVQLSSGLARCNHLHVPLLLQDDASFPGGGRARTGASSQHD